MEVFTQFSEQMAVAGVLFYVLAFVVSLCLVIFVHELGHYSVARLFGVRVDNFSIGFGREIVGRTDRHGTRWSLSWIPLGGYIKIFGDVDPANPHIWDHDRQEKRALTPEELEQAFFTKRIWQRSLIVLAGPLINILFTVLLLAFLFAVKGEVSSPPIITAIAKETAGYEAGFRLDDEILAVNGVPIQRFEDVWVHSKNEIGVPLSLTVRRGAKIFDLSVTPRPVDYTDERGVERAHGRLGITHFSAVNLKDIESVNGVPTAKDLEKARKLIQETLGRDAELGLLLGEGKVDIFLVHLPLETNENLSNLADEDSQHVFVFTEKNKFYVRHTPVESLKYSLKQTGHIMSEALKILKVLLTGKSKGDNQVGGAGAIGYMAGKAAETGWFSYVVFIAVLSTQIGFINLMPIPVLDGGHLMFYLYETVARKPLPERIKEIFLIAGLIFLFALMIVANMTDILQLTRS